MRRYVVLLLLLSFYPAFAQEAPKSSSVDNIDMGAFVRETQQSINEKGYVGLVWWIPTEYWEISSERSGVSEQNAKLRFEPLRKYTIVAVSIGKMGIGNVNWIAEPEIRETISLRDSEGNAYPPLQKLSGDAEGLVSLLRPVFANLLGAMGQNIQLFFFSGTNKMAKPLVDPSSPGSFSVVLSKALEGKDKTFEWKLPLTALSPPKYCPVGKERVEANWKYCPWHGVKLDEPVSAATVQK
jgi:hypothetical protein